MSRCTLHLGIPLPGAPVAQGAAAAASADQRRHGIIVAPEGPFVVVSVQQQSEAILFFSCGHRSHTLIVLFLFRRLPLTNSTGSLTFCLSNDVELYAKS